MGKKAMVLGGTGLVGGHLVKELANCEEYTEITLLSRREAGTRNNKVKEKIINMEELEKHEAEFQVDEIFCCLGTTIKKAGSKEAFKKIDYSLPVLAASLGAANGARQFLVVSAMGADRQSPFFYNKVKGEMEAAIKQINYESIHIFRPSLLVGERDEFRIGEKLAEWAARPFKGLMSGRLKKYAPIEAAMVARAMANAAGAAHSGITIHESDAILMLGEAFR